MLCCRGTPEGVLCVVGGTPEGVLCVVWGTSEGVLCCGGTSDRHPYSTVLLALDTTPSSLHIVE